MKILFTSTLLTSFIREDLRLLAGHFEVRHLFTRGILAPLRILAGVLRADVTYTWFASAYSFFVVLLAGWFGKKSIIVVGGVDAARFPEINYGIWLSPWKSALVRYAMHHAHKLLVVDPFLEKEVKRLANYPGGNIMYVPTGYDPKVWHNAGEKERSVLTVAACHDMDRLRKKGLDILFAAASRLPDVRFTVVGLFPEVVERVSGMIPHNVEAVAFVEQGELLHYYQRAKVYCQPSFVEGLPNSVCEAMLCECVPVGSNAGGIPTAIGDRGMLVPYGDVDALAGALRKALDAPPEAGRLAREYIAATFPLSRRESALVGILNEAVN